MEPTLHSGQKLISFNWGIKPKVGDLVAVNNGNKLIVKRVKEIKDDEVYILGDNPQQSTDSRRFGWIKTEQITGKVIWVG